jgi:hypothetical protein
MIDEQDPCSRLGAGYEILNQVCVLMSGSWE